MKVGKIRETHSDLGHLLCVGFVVFRTEFNYEVNVSLNLPIAGFILLSAALLVAWLSSH